MRPYPCPACGTRTRPRATAPRMEHQDRLPGAGAAGLPGFWMTTDRGVPSGPVIPSGCEVVVCHAGKVTHWPRVNGRPGPLKSKEFLFIDALL